MEVSISLLEYIDSVEFLRVTGNWHPAVGEQDYWLKGTKLPHGLSGARGVTLRFWPDPYPGHPMLPWDFVLKFFMIGYSQTFG